MRKKIHRLGASYTKAMIGKADTQMFVVLGNRRDIRQGTVAKLRRLLEAGEHFDTPLMANVKAGKLRLLDGNHRLEAIKLFLEKYPDNKVEIGIFCYKDLDEDTERLIYTKWNLGTKQTVNDFIKQYWNKIPLALKFNGNFPYRIKPKWSGNAMEFKMFVQAYRGTVNETYKGSKSQGALEFIQWCQGLGDADYTMLKSFLTEYMSVFGNPSKRNMHYHGNLFPAIMHIWRWNSTKVNPNRMIQSLSKLRGHERIVYYSSFRPSREVSIMAHRDILNVLNGRRKKPIFT